MEIVSYGDKIPYGPPFQRTKVIIRWDRFTGWRGKLECPSCHRLKRSLYSQGEGKPEICGDCLRRQSRKSTGTRTRRKEIREELYRLLRETR